MKNICKYLCILFLCFTSCGGEDLIGEQENSELLGTKWTLTNWDYSLGEDYIGLHDETYEFFFHSSNQGFFYYGRKDYYTNQGNDNQRAVCHFKYSINEDVVLLDYITEEILNIRFLNINNNVLTCGKLEFKKETISNTDWQWIKTICGTTGSCNWYSNLKDKLWIAGEGAMGNYTSYSNTPWAKNKRTPNKVIINDGVTTIGAHSFANESISDVQMPENSLKSINKGAFKNSSIKSIYLSDNTTVIEAEAFTECTYLENINIPQNIERIEEYAFSDCCSLNNLELTFGSNLKSIGNYAFQGCQAPSLTFSEGVKDISTGAFLGDYCGTSKELILPNSLESIGAIAFEGAYKKIFLGTGITNIEDKAFISGATTGEMYVNLSTPPTASGSIIVERESWTSAESNWTLYVPRGCRSAYANKVPWSKFKAIIEDSNLKGEIVDDNITDENNDILVNYKDLSYITNGNKYKMIFVDSDILPPFYIMQTELDICSEFHIGGKNIGKADINGDGCLIKSEFRTFLRNLRDATGLDFRLPTIEEWEYAAKGGKYSKGYIYSGSNNIEDVAWYKNNSNETKHLFAKKTANELGIYDMSGNFGEICQINDDIYNIDGTICGGCWNDYASDCKISSKKEGNTSQQKIPGTSLKELNAFNGKYITIRLVYSIPDGEYAHNSQVNGHRFVDLGLSVKWAACNIGAKYPEECGNYFAWGEIKNKNEYTESNNTTNNKKIDNIKGDSKYDAGTANWGWNWRMPTKDEFNELISNCKWKWTKKTGQKNDSSTTLQYGYTITGPNGNSIFLPATGKLVETNKNEYNELGHYWSAESDIEYKKFAYSFSFKEGDKYFDFVERYLGFCIRPVVD